MFTLLKFRHEHLHYTLIPWPQGKARELCHALTQYWMHPKGLEKCELVSGWFFLRCLISRLLSSDTATLALMLSILKHHQCFATFKESVSYHRSPQSTISRGMPARPHKDSNQLLGACYPFSCPTLCTGPPATIRYTLRLQHHAGKHQVGKYSRI